MSTDPLDRPHKHAQTVEPLYQRLLDYFRQEGPGLQIDWQGLIITGLSRKLSDNLQKAGFIDHECHLSQEGLAVLGRILIDLRDLQHSTPLVADRYQIERLLVAGRNSATYLVRHKVLQRRSVLKLVRPGVAPELVKTLAKLGSGQMPQNLVQPHDYFNFEHVDVFGNRVELQAMVFDYVEAPTLLECLNDSPPLTPHFVLAFVQQVATALSALENLGLQHGDLHAGNILVSNPQDGDLRFYLIDISAGIGTTSDHRRSEGDFSQFQSHLWKVLQILQRNLSSLSLRKHLGARIALLTEHILNLKDASFVSLSTLIGTDDLFREFQIERKRFLAERFSQPSSFGILRFEEFTDPAIALSLFEPYPELFAKLKRFGPTLLYGHRGSGKSTYLAALAADIGPDPPLVNLEEIFGVYFACRQGEFKSLSEDLVKVTPASLLAIKHLLILKIIRRLCQSLAAAVSAGRIEARGPLHALYAFIQPFVTEGQLGAFDSRYVLPLDNLASSLLRPESELVQGLLSGRFSQHTGVIALREKDLIAFCELVREAVPALAHTRFYVAFDDAGTPNLPVLCQRVLNELVRATNPVVCIKLSAERYSYELQDTHGKHLEDPHDIVELNIGTTLFVSTSRRRHIKSYFERILTRRLESFNYKSKKIEDYLGSELTPPDKLVARLAAGGHRAYFAGWNVVWQLADRTPRHLIEFVSSIFEANSVQPASSVTIVPAREQHLAVLSVSERRLRSLGSVPGTLEIGGLRAPLGPHLYAFAVSFGAIACNDLTRSASNRRPTERLAIERNDSGALAEDAEAVLEHLLRYNVLDDSHLHFARDDRTKKPLYVLNRVFAPALRISFRRDRHLVLSQHNFESLLLEPYTAASARVQRGRKRGQTESFNYELFPKVGGPE